MPSTLNEFLENALKGQKVDEADYMAGKGGELLKLVQVLVGWPKDIQRMIGMENYDGALKSLSIYKTKVIPDLEKKLKKISKVK